MELPWAEVRGNADQVHRDFVFRNSDVFYLQCHSTFVLTTTGCNYI